MRSGSDTTIHNKLTFNKQKKYYKSFFSFFVIEIDINVNWKSTKLVQFVTFSIIYHSLDMNPPELEPYRVAVPASAPPIGSSSA
jgi:hypothetical protein